MTITAQDSSNEPVTIEYTISQTQLPNPKTFTDWTTYQSTFSLSTKQKYIVYAKLTDPSGNETIINSDGVVVFTDSTKVTTDIQFTKTTTTDVTATINLNGNTIKEISIAGHVLTPNTDYTVSGNTITLKANYLDTLAAGDYNVFVSFYPLGETGTANEGSDLPSSVEMSLKVVKAEPVLSIVANPTGSQTRPNSVVLSANLTAGATGNLQYKANGINIGEPVAVGQTVSFTASGSVNDYHFTVEYSGDENYLSATSDELSYSFVKGEQSALSFVAGTPTVKTYGDDGFAIAATGGSGTGAITYSVSGPATVSGDTITLTGVGEVVLWATKAADDDYNEKFVEHTISVNKKEVIITGITAENKTYDADTVATLSGTAVLDGKVAGDDVNIVTGTATFADKNVGNNKTVTFDGFTLSGSDSDKYALIAQPDNVTADITAKTITMDVTIQSKAYDGHNTAVIAGTSLKGIVSGDAVSLVTSYPTATFTSVSTGSNIPVQFDGDFLLTGSDADNYTLIQPSATGDITNNYTPIRDTDYIINRTGWGNTDFVITAKSGFELSQTNTAGGEWSDTLTKSEETNDDSVLFYVRNKATGEISLAASESYQIDKTAPMGDITIGESSIKKALNTITFGLFFKDTKRITLTATDEGSGVKSLAYKLSSMVLDESEVEEISDWTEYTGPITVQPDNRYVVYVKMTDHAGNIVYIGSDGLVLDSTAPVISGIEEGTAYCSAVTINVSDANPDTVTVDGVTTELTDGKFVLAATGKAQTIVATDKAGNSTTMTVTVYDGHEWDAGVIIEAPTASKKGVKTYTCIHCKETRTEEIDKLAPAIIEGAKEPWKPGDRKELTFKSDAAFSDFISVMVDGKVIDAKNYDLKEDGIVVTLKAEYLATLSAGTHSLGIQCTSGTASTEFIIAAKVDEDDKEPAKNTETPSPQTDTPSPGTSAPQTGTDSPATLAPQTGTDSPEITGTPKVADKVPTKDANTTTPQTGDNNPMFLWIALLFVTGGMVAGYQVKNNKRKTVK